MPSNSENVHAAAVKVASLRPSLGATCEYRLFLETKTSIFSQTPPLWETNTIQMMHGTDIFFNTYFVYLHNVDICTYIACADIHTACTLRSTTIMHAAKTSMQRRRRLYEPVSWPSHDHSHQTVVKIKLARHDLHTCGSRYAFRMCIALHACNVHELCMKCRSPCV